MKRRKFLLNVSRWITVMFAFCVLGSLGGIETGTLTVVRGLAQGLLFAGLTYGRGRLTSEMELYVADLKRKSH